MKLEQLRARYRQPLFDLSIETNAPANFGLRPETAAS